jgi:type IV secretory pathway component VirB8
MLGSSDAPPAAADVAPGQYTGSAQTGDQDRSLRKALRMVVFFAGGEMLIIILLVIGLDQLIPLRRDVPYFLQGRPWDQAVLEVHPLSMRASKETLLAEMDVAKYIRLRYEVEPDLAEMDRRWGEHCSEENDPVGYEENDLLCSYMKVHTSGSEYAGFRGSIVPIKEFIDSGMMRTVTLQQDPIRRHDGEYEVRFVMKDFDCPSVVPPKKGRAATCTMPVETRRQYFSAIIYYGYQDVSLSVRNRHLNPQGFMVDKIELSEWKDPSLKGTGK